VCCCGCRKMWHWVAEGDRLLRWLEAAPLLELDDVSGQLGEALLRVIRDELAGPQVAEEFRKTVSVLRCVVPAKGKEASPQVALTLPVLGCAVLKWASLGSALQCSAMLCCAVLSWCVAP
jgi:hypothetical protein